MSNVNSTALSGNLTRDPELKVLPSGTKVCEFGIAVNRTRKDESAEGGYTEEASFFELVAWSGFAELIARKAKKGDAVTVTGRLEQQRWETDSGDKRSKVRVVVEQMDGQWQFRSKDEENDTSTQPVAGQTELPTEAAAAAAPDDDGIPF